MADEKIWSSANNPDRVVAEKVGMDRNDLGTAIHKIKKAAGLGGADSIDLYRDGDVADQQTGEIIGNVKDELF